MQAPRWMRIWLPAGALLLVLAATSPAQAPPEVSRLQATVREVRLETRRLREQARVEQERLLGRIQELSGRIDAQEAATRRAEQRARSAEAALPWVGLAAVLGILLALAALARARSTVRVEPTVQPIRASLRELDSRLQALEQDVGTS